MGRIEMSDETPKGSSGTPPFTAEDAMAFMQKMWNPFGMPMPGSAAGAVDVTAPAPSAERATAPWGAPGGMFAFPNPAAMFAALDPKEIDRRIADLRVIEGWLAMTLNLMQMGIRTLELQRTSLEALQSAHAPAKKVASKRRKG
jgi:hypothetical protein